MQIEWFGLIRRVRYSWQQGIHHLKGWQCALQQRQNNHHSLDFDLSRFIVSFLSNLLLTVYLIMWFLITYYSKMYHHIFLCILMQDQIITQQIDIVVIGNRKYELMNLMLDQDYALEEHKRKRSHTSYLGLLSKLINRGAAVRESSKVMGAVRSNSISKFTKIILTESFWLHLHFFVHDNKIFDPFVFDANKGSISICIIAAAENLDLTETKAYLLQTNPHIAAQRLPELHLKDQTSTVKPETVIEGKIYSLIHQASVEGFSSVLALKITDQGRIIEQSSNLRLTVNQISRWIVDRHFQNKHKIKIRQQLGDEIQNFEYKEEKSYCHVM